MNSYNSHKSTDSVTTATIRHFPKEPTMNRLFIALLSMLIIAIFALSATPAFAQDSTPGTVDADDAAYLQEYEQRAADKYQTLKATRQAARNAAVAADIGGELFVQEYNQRARDIYAAISRPAPVAQAETDWMGAGFLVEYEQRAQVGYQLWLAQQNGRLTGSTSR